MLRNIFLLFIFIVSINLKAQEVKQNRFIITKKINKLLEKKADCNTKINFNRIYHIQIYNGQNLSRAKSVKLKFESNFNFKRAFVKWENPEFKVWVGDYENKLSADQALLKIKKEFPNAFIVNPKK